MRIEYGIQFNPEKTMIVIFNLDCERQIEDIQKDPAQVSFELAGKKIEIVDSMIVLGQVLSNNNNDLKNVSQLRIQ
jgi:hypothetical protein